MWSTACHQYLLRADISWKEGRRETRARLNSGGKWRESSPWPKQHCLIIMIFFTLLLFQGLPIEELMAHQIIFVMDLCHNFKFGQDTREKDLKRRLLIPFTKCLMERKMLSVKFSYAFNYQQAQPQPKLRLQHPPNQHAPGRNGRVFCWGQPKMILNVM